MSGVLNFQKRVMRTASKAVDSLGISSEDARFLLHNRPAPPHAAIYCQECAEPLRPDTIACPACGWPNSLKLSSLSVSR